MRSHKVSRCLLFLTIGSVLTAGCQLNPGSESPEVLGAVEIRDEQAKSQWPAELPKMIYVSDFALEAEHVEVDQGVSGLLPGGRLGRIGQRLPHPGAHSNPEEQAQKIIDEMSQSLVKSLGEKGLISQRLPSPQAGLPREGWLVQGVFTEVDEGNRIKRAVIGLGRGATHMEVQVAISNLAGDKPKSPFIVFGTVKTPKTVPGAAVTMNPYVAAAKFVMEKNVTEQDIRKTAESIVDEILKHTDQFKNETLVNPPKSRP